MIDCYAFVRIERQSGQRQWDEIEIRDPERVLDELVVEVDARGGIAALIALTVRHDATYYQAQMR